MYEDDFTGPAVIATGGAVLAGVAIGQWWLAGIAAVLSGLALVALSRLVSKPTIKTRE